MIVNTVYQNVLLISNKNQSGGYLSPTDFNKYANFAQLDVINELCDLLGYNQKVSTLISDVTKVRSVDVLSSGYINKPSDYYRYLDSNALFYDNGKWEEYAVDYVSKSERGERLQSKIVDPTTKYPVATEDATGGVLIDPKSVKKLKLIYVAEPDTVDWVGIGVPPVFDEVASTDFVLSSKFINILVFKICKLFGIEIANGDLYNATTESLVKELGVRR